MTAYGSSTVSSSSSKQVVKSMGNVQSLLRPAAAKQYRCSCSNQAKQARLMVLWQGLMSLKGCGG